MGLSTFKNAALTAGTGGWSGPSPVGENARVSRPAPTSSAASPAPGAPSTPGATTSSTAGSAEWFERARRVTPGGVNSPVRAFNAVGGTPRFMASGQGAWLRDVDGHEYVDLICSWG